MNNWKTRLLGILAIVLVTAGPVLNSYVPVRGMSWVELMTSIAALVGGGGLLLAKSYDTHSTPDQVQASGVKAALKATPDASFFVNNYGTCSTSSGTLFPTSFPTPPNPDAVPTWHEPTP